MIKKTLPLPKNAQLSGCGKPPEMSFRDIIRWWFSPHYKEEMDNMIFLHKRHGDRYYLMKTIYLKKNISDADAVEDIDELSEDL